MKLLLMLALVVMAGLLSGCATMMAGEGDHTKQTINIVTDPVGANIKIINAVTNEIIKEATSPMVIALDKLAWSSTKIRLKYKDVQYLYMAVQYEVIITKPNYFDEIIYIEKKPKVSGAVGNAFSFGIIGDVIDTQSGTNLELIPNSINLMLFKKSDEGIRGRANYFLKKSIDSDKSDDEKIYDIAEVISIHKETASAYLYRASIYSKKGDYQKTIEDINTYLLYEKPTAESYKILGSAYKQKNNFKESLDNFNNAIKLKKDYAEVYFERAKLFYKDSQFDKAQNDIITACSMGFRKSCDYKF